MWTVLIRSCAHSLRSVDGLKHSKTWKLCGTNLLQQFRSLHVDSAPQTPALTSSYVHGTSSNSLLSLTVGQSLESTVQRWPNREAVVFLEEGIRKTFAEFQQDVDKVAAGLLALGLKQADRLGVWGPNTYEWILFQFASAKAGIILVSLNPAYQVREVDFTLKKAKVVDPATGKIVPLGTPGELMIRGNCVMLGYWDDPEKTSEVISQDRWYRTGDTASLNSLGYCRIEGRIKDMIIRGGENIYPTEIEQFVYTHPKVQEVQVVGVKDERLGEQVCACIRLKEGQTSSAEEIRAFCKGQISHFKIPHYVFFVDSYPMTVTRKIKKNVLKEIMEKKLGL